MAQEVETQAGDRKHDDVADSPPEKAVPKEGAADKLSLEEKFVLLEERFAELEQKYATLKLKPQQVNISPEVKTEVSSIQLRGVFCQATDIMDKTPVQSSKDADKQEEKLPPTSRVRVRIARVENGERKYSESNSEKDSPDHPIELRLIYAHEENYGELEIRSKSLCKLLKRLLPHYPGVQHIGDTLTLTSPYEYIVLNWDLLWKASLEECSNDEDAQARSELQDVLKEIKKESGDVKLGSYLKARDDLIRQENVTFDTLWTIFPPGEVVYGHPFLKNRPNQEQNHQLFVVEDNYWPWPIRTEGRQRRIYDWRLRCLIYDHDGTQFRRHSVWLSFKYFEGPKPIKSLPYYPLNAMEATKRASIEKVLLERGERFKKFCTADEGDRMFQYTGDAIFEQSGFRGVGDPEQSEVDVDDEISDRNKASSTTAEKTQKFLPLTKSNVMVDFMSYSRYGPDTTRMGDLTVVDVPHDCECQDCTKNGKLKDLFKPHYDELGKDPDSTWEPFQLMLCPPRVLGYVLQEKQWGQLDVNKLTIVEEEHHENVLNNLHLPGKDKGKSKKEFLMGLVRNHGKLELTDIVAGKGEGLVFLLYGEPGVGKTSTAQIIARAARKPLLSIGVANVGTNAKEVESNLQTLFNLATTWRAILLIDEADVFLQNRNGSALSGPSAEGSALVSVFLRVLEYYRGILFLTTNQIAQFDVAVQSRVHIALHYQKLSDDQTFKIFMSFVNQYRDRNLISDREYRRMEKYADSEAFQEKGFDGRQIRNIVGCAMSHAKGQKDSMMTLEHIEDVVGYVKRFTDDLKGQRRDWRKKQAEAGMA
ncbi:hypothetical protein Q7P37_006161 [Cladosporium fusiforme]